MNLYKCSAEKLDENTINLSHNVIKSERVADQASWS